MLSTRYDNVHSNRMECESQGCLYVRSIWICKAALLLNDSHYFVFAVIFIVWHIINNIYWVNLHFLDVYRLQWMWEGDREGECWWRPVRNKTCDEIHKLPLTHILTEFVLFDWPAATAAAVVGWTHSTKWNFEWKNFPKPNSSHAMAIDRQPHWDGNDRITGGINSNNYILAIITSVMTAAQHCHITYVRSFERHAGVHTHQQPDNSLSKIKFIKITTRQRQPAPTKRKT